jgi:ferric-dicitrate binding protein FerR (iron transport regulator)
MKTSNPDPRELLLAYLDDDLDAPGVARLSNALEHDPDFRRDAVTMVVQELHFCRMGERLKVEDWEWLDDTAKRGLDSVFAHWVTAVRGWVRRPLAWTVAAVTLAIVVGLSVGWRSQGPRLKRLTGKVMLVRQGRTTLTSSGRSLRPNDGLRLETGAFVELAYRREPTSLRFWSGAQVTIGPGIRGKTLTLHKGEMTAMVAPQAADAPMRIQTPHGAAIVLGTDFSLAVTSRATRLEVWGGTVRLADPTGGTSASVTKGEFAELTDSGSLDRGPMRQGVKRECWLGEAVSPARPLAEVSCFARQPDFTEIIHDFSVQPNWNDGYVSRLRAWLRPSVTGLYQFWVTGDDRVELWLSSDAIAEHKTRICWTTDWTEMDDWDKSPAQKSRSIQLDAGRKYYIEALHYDEAGGDFAAVAWQPPAKGREVITGSNLVPYIPNQPNESVP